MALSPRKEVEKMIEKKQEEISGWKVQIERAEIYIQALKDTLKKLPLDEGELDLKASHTLRPGSVLEKAQSILQQVGKPLHVSEIIQRMGKSFTGNQRNGLVGSLSSYAKKRRIFTKPGPNIFGLIDFPVSFEPSTKGTEPQPLRVVTN